MNLIQRILPKGWTETKISEDTYFLDIPKKQLDEWQLNQWKKDKVEKLIKKDGFYLKNEGRNGTIYFVENGELCQMYYENSAVREFDILIFIERLKEWQLPTKKAMTENEIKVIREKLLVWLNKKNLKSDL